VGVERGVGLHVEIEVKSAVRFGHMLCQQCQFHGSTLAAMHAVTNWWWAHLILSPLALHPQPEPQPNPQIKTALTVDVHLVGLALEAPLWVGGG